MQRPEVFASILHSEGHDVEFNPPDWDGRWDSIFINGIPLDGGHISLTLSITYHQY